MTTLKRSRVMRMDGKLINLVHPRGHLLVCPKGRCGLTDQGLAPLSENLYYNKWERRGLRNRVRQTQSGRLGSCTMANTVLLVFDRYPIWFQSLNTEAQILLMALLLDSIVGEPPNRWHPVVWMGSLINALRKHAPQRGNTVSFIYGGLITVGGASLVASLALFVTRAARKLPFPLDVVAQAWLLKTTFSLSGLNKAALEVENALRANNLAEARRLLSWHLVSRDTSQLNEVLVAAAAIESVAENTSDGIVAPLLWYGIGGIPAALVYRYINTGDSILGYRDAEREWLGKIPARTDDLLNLIPARVTALLFVLLRPRAWKIWRRDAGITASPNAGHPMSAMAGVLDVELEKVAHYKLNAGARPPNADDLRRSRQFMFRAVGILVLILTILLRSKND